MVVSYGASSWCKGVVYWFLKSIGFCDSAWGVGAWGSQTAGMGYLDLFRPFTASTVLLNDISGRSASISSTHACPVVTSTVHEGHFEILEEGQGLDITSTRSAPS